MSYRIIRVVDPRGLWMGYDVGPYKIRYGRFYDPFAEPEEVVGREISNLPNYLDLPLAVRDHVRNRSLCYYCKRGTTSEMMFFRSGKRLVCRCNYCANLSRPTEN